LEAIKHILSRYIAFVWAVLKPFGSWAVFAIAGLDSAFFGLPLDPVVATYVYQDRPRFLLYALMAAAGSAAGCIILYVLGYKGGEVLLQRRLTPAKFYRIRDSFERHKFWALMFPSMIPPPFPFKLFVLAASAFEMNFWHFLLAIFLGRFVRFLILSVLVLAFGPQIIGILSAVVIKHLIASSVLATAIGVIVVLLWYRTRH
jgi:membrane protein YqaA with SNARE-associated domain